MKTLFSGLGLVFLIGGPALAQARGAEPLASEVVAGAGVFNVFHDDDSAQLMGWVEYRFAELKFGLRPWVGAAQAEAGTRFLSAGLLYTREIRGRWRLSAGFAPTCYDDNGGKDLGRALEFYSFGEVGRVLGNGHVVGLRFGHLSNAGLARTNPGVETLTLTYVLPLEARGGRSDL